MNLKVPASFTLDQLVAHLQGEAPGGQPSQGFYTVSQWAEQFGIGAKRIREFIAEAKRVGAVKLETVRHERIDGKPCFVTAYAFDLDKLQGATKKVKKRGA
jgi:hypothetical protein